VIWATLSIKGAPTLIKGYLVKIATILIQKKKIIIKIKIKNPKKTKIILIMSPEHHNKDAKNYNR
jgi:hypothetical protein